MSVSQIQVFSNVSIRHTVHCAAIPDQGEQHYPITGWTEPMCSVCGEPTFSIGDSFTEL
jgi:hypothetical protein